MTTQRLYVGPGAFDFAVAPDVDFDVLLTLNTVNADGSQGMLFDLTDYTASMLVTDPLSGDETVDTLNTTNGRIVLGGTAGTIEIKSTKTEMADYPSGPCRYALLITSPSPSLFTTGIAGGSFTTNVSP